jgi:hypothetical protein
LVRPFFFAEVSGLLKKLRLPPSGTSVISILSSGSQGRREEEPGAYWVVREASGATMKWRQVTSAAETVRRPRFLSAIAADGLLGEPVMR